jgi:hypothetical protein
MHSQVTQKRATERTNTVNGYVFGGNEKHVSKKYKNYVKQQVSLQLTVCYTSNLKKNCTPPCLCQYDPYYHYGVIFTLILIVIMVCHNHVIIKCIVTDIFHFFFYNSLKARFDGILVNFVKLII